MKYQPLAPILILCIALILLSCTSFTLLTSPKPTPSPTPECIGDTWSYAGNVRTKIEISPDLVFMLVRACDLCYPYSITIHGDGWVVYERYSEDAIDKYIPIDQLQQIIKAFEDANFYAVSPGCGGESLIVRDAGFLNISVVKEGKIHTIEDHGACAAFHFWRYCGLADKIEEILGIPW